MKHHDINYQDTIHHNMIGAILEYEKLGGKFIDPVVKANFEQQQLEQRSAHTRTACDSTVDRLDLWYMGGDQNYLLV